MGQQLQQNAVLPLSKAILTSGHLLGTRGSLCKRNCFTRNSSEELCTWCRSCFHCEQCVYIVIWCSFSICCSFSLQLLHGRDGTYASIHLLQGTVVPESCKCYAFTKAALPSTTYTSERTQEQALASNLSWLQTLKANHAPIPVVAV